MVTSNTAISGFWTDVTGLNELNTGLPTSSYELDGEFTEFPVLHPSYDTYNAPDYSYYYYVISYSYSSELEGADQVISLDYPCFRSDDT